MGAREVWRFGILHRVEIDERPAAWEPLDYLPEQPDVAAWLGGRRMKVVGEFDGMLPLLTLEGETTVYAVAEGTPYAVFPVARSLDAARATLNDAAALWVGLEGETSLPVTETNLGLARMILDDFAAANPDINTAPWEDLCFAGLTLALPLA